MNSIILCSQLYCIVFFYNSIYLIYSKFGGNSEIYQFLSFIQGYMWQGIKLTQISLRPELSLPAFLVISHLVTTKAWVAN